MSVPYPGVLPHNEFQAPFLFGISTIAAALSEPPVPVQAQFPVHTVFRPGSPSAQPPEFLRAGKYHTSAF